MVGLYIFKIIISFIKSILPILWVITDHIHDLFVSRCVDIKELNNLDIHRPYLRRSL